MYFHSPYMPSWLGEGQLYVLTFYLLFFSEHTKANSLNKLGGKKRKKKKEKKKKKKKKKKKEREREGGGQKCSVFKKIF